MFLKNYTSNVPVSQTIARIESVLIRCGVAGIAKEYGPNMEIVAITFRVQDEGRDFNVRLPTNKEQALQAMWLDYAGEDLNADGTFKYGSRKKLRKKDFAEQAERTAWKIIQDWIEVQMSMIQMRQAKSIEVFLPYIWDGKETVFNRIRESGYRALLPEKTEAA